MKHSLQRAFWLFLLCSIGTMGALQSQTISVSPNTGEQGDVFGVTITGTNTTWSTLTSNCVELTNGGTTITFSGTPLSTTILNGTINIPLGADLGDYDVVVYDGGTCMGATDGACADCFTVTAPPVATIALSPNTGEQGDMFGVTITGASTTWSSSHCVELTNGSTTFTFTGTAVSATSLSGMVSIPVGADLGNYDVVVYDDNSGTCGGSIDGACVDCFTVASPPPATIALNPNTGEQGDVFGITITGIGTTWSTPTSHCVELTNGGTTITFTGTATSVTSLSGMISIPIGADLGDYDVVVYDDNSGTCGGSINGSCVDCFEVTAIACPTPMVILEENLCLSSGPQLIVPMVDLTGGVFSGPGVTDNGDGMTFTFDPLVAGEGSFQVTYTYTDPMSGCISVVLSQAAPTNVIENPMTAMPCYQFETTGGVNVPWEDLVSFGIPCDNSCGPVVLGIEVWQNEGYLLPATANSQYTFEFCSGYSPATWDAIITVALYDSDNGMVVSNSAIAAVNDCSITFTTPTTDEYVIIISDVGSNCDGALQTIDNGEITFGCGPNGACCDPAGCDASIPPGLITVYSCGIELSPDTGEQGDVFGVTLTGMGTTWSSSHCVELTNGGTTITFTGTAASATSLSGTISIPGGADLGDY
ncbi:MAG: hypothetical protein ACRBG0_23695, partial [Lewinella sp.]|uniref:hypothetical protein n=1 Tax=Lewinella sp. TaxID=2004506 RepID=UPI003D6AE065